MPTRRVITSVIVGALLLASATVATAPAADAFDPTPRVPNGGFEAASLSGPDDWTVAFGVPSNFAVSASPAFAGLRSLHVLDSSSSLSAGLRSEAIGVNAGASYRFSFEMYRLAGYPQVFAYFYDAAGAQLASSSATFGSSTVETWTSAAVTLTAPSGAAGAALMIYSGVASLTDTYVDDARIEDAAEPAIVNGSFEQPAVGGSVALGWTQSYGSGGFSLDRSVSRSGTTSLRMLDTSETTSIGLTSSPVAVESGHSYSVDFGVYKTSGTPQMHLTYLDGTGAQVSTVTTNLSSSTTGGWQQWSVPTTAPVGSVTATIRFYSPVASTSTVNFDDVDLAEAGSATDLGSPVDATNTIESAYGKGPSGEDWIYTVANGDPATLIVIESDGGAVVGTFAVPGAKGAYGVKLAPNGDLYIGGWGSRGDLYRYRPGATAVEDLGRPEGSNDTFVWGLATDEDSNAYVALYPSGSVAKWDSSIGTFTADSGQLSPGLPYAHSVAVIGQTVYAGTGPEPHLYAMDRSLGTKSEIPLPGAMTSSADWVYWLTAVGDLLFVYTDSPLNAMFVYDTSTASWSGEIDNASGYDVTEPDASGLIYLVSESTLQSYDPGTGLLSDLGMSSGRMRGAGLIEIDDPLFPGESVSSMQYDGTYWVYNISTGSSKVIDPEIPQEPLSVRALCSTDEGVYASGFLSGGLGFFDFDSDSMAADLSPLVQVEGMTESEDGSIYLGGYPGAEVLRYVPSQPWVAGVNPVKLFDMEEEDQDRPFAIVEAGDLVAIGTVPGYGDLGGALTFYDPASGQHEVHRNVVEYQSVTALVFEGGKLYGGTSISGGLGSTPTTTTAEVFEWDLETDSLLWSQPLALGTPSVQGLTVDAAGLLWGTTGDGTVFSFDPATRMQTSSTRVAPAPTTDHYWPDSGGQLYLDTSGDLYGALLSRFFRLDPATGAFQVLNTSTSVAVPGENHDYYLASGSELYRWRG